MEIMDKEKWAEYQRAAMKSQRLMEQKPFTREQALEQQRRLDKAAGRSNLYLGLSFNELKIIHRG